MRRTVWAALIALLIPGGGALAENFPSHPITIIVTFSAGDPSEAMARILAERMKVTLGEALLIENVTGAGGSVGCGRPVRQPPHGSTISLGHSGTPAPSGWTTSRGIGPVTD